MFSPEPTATAGLEHRRRWLRAKQADAIYAMDDTQTTVAELKEAVGRFAAERAWEPFHSPKNLAMGLAIEAAELMEHFLWVDCEASRALAQDPGKRGDIADEVADVACHLFNLCNALKLDLSQAFRAKLVKNAQKYPVEKYKGRFEIQDG